MNSEVNRYVGTVSVYIFPAASEESIRRGLDTGWWAVPKKSRVEKATQRKAEQMPPESFGVFYLTDCYLTAPFVTKTWPDDERPDSDIWDEEHDHYFRIDPLGSTRTLPKLELQQFFQKTIKRSGHTRWCDALCMRPTQYFVPSLIVVEDWKMLLKHLADAT